MTGVGERTSAVLRWDVPVDDQEHTIRCGRIVHVDCRDPHAVTFWALDESPKLHTLRVLGTGHSVPAGWVYVGTALSPELPPFSPRGALVWHLFEATP